MGNSRGTENSLGHISLNSSEDAYWDFSFDEMGMYDVPANIEFIKAHTGVEKLTYVGHSQGTTQFWIANIYHPTFAAENIEAFIGIAPVMYTSHTFSVFTNWALALRLDKVL